MSKQLSHNTRPRCKSGGGLYRYLSTVGTITINRRNVAQFTRDLPLRSQDFISLVDRMHQVGRAKFDGAELRIAGPAAGPGMIAEQLGRALAGWRL